MRLFRIYFILLTLAVSSAAWAQHEIRGTVKDESGQALFGASVYLHETFQGTLANDSGYFEIKGINPGKYHLHVTYVGYHAFSQDILVGSDSAFLQVVLEPSDLELHEAVLEENALKLDKHEYPISVWVLGQEQIQKNIGPTLSNALEHLPGINSMNTGLNVSKPVIRGMTGNRIVVAENGIKQEGQQWGGDHGLEMDPFNAEKIEVIKGPAALLYGSDAIGGLIHIKQPLIPVSGKHEATASTQYKSVNQSYGSSLSFKGNAKGWVYRFRLTGMDYGDYQVPADSFTYNRYRLPLVGGRIKNTAGKEWHIAAQVGINRKWGFTRLSFTRFDQQIGVFPGAIGIPRSYDLQDDQNRRNLDLPRQHILHHKVLSNTNIQLGKDWLEIDAAMQWNHRQEYSSPHAHGQAIGTSSLAHGLLLQTGSVMARYHREGKRRSRTYGLSYMYQSHRFNGFEFLLPAFATQQLGAFVFQKYTLNTRSTISAGIRGDWASVNIQEHKQAVFENGIPVGEQLRVAKNNRSFLNWSGAVGWTYAIDSKTTLKTNLGKSFRMPSAQELSVNGVHHGSFRHEVGDPNLNAEQAWQLDFALEYEKKSLFIGFTPFLNYFGNYIFLRPTAQFSPLPEAGQIFQYEQTTALLTGGEFSTEYHPIKQIHIEAGMEYVLARNINENLPLPFIPPFQIKSAIEWEWAKDAKRWEEGYIRLAWTYADAQNETDRNEKATPAYHVWNLGAGIHWKLTSNYHLELSIMCRNLFNQQYMNHLSRWRYLNLPEPGRNLMVQLNIPLITKKASQK
ncbi:MAG: TonB-dependent receptor [Bacteroidota bacterium]|nr:TonB-dependent receptor [Bacteroidota bacterium]MDX5430046.1 TonB-dependent receptor [Bacteroidota bacterium]MDX5468816.1 TonB-dependent receptor [Bacteroidota bacterium]